MMPQQCQNPFSARFQRFLVRREVRSLSSFVLRRQRSNGRYTEMGQDCTV